jgi:hypothetical protein
MREHWLGSLDAWKQRAPEMPSVSRHEHQTKYVCRAPGCQWHGWNALDHHRDPFGTGRPLKEPDRHHPIALRNAPDHWPTVQFGCCVPTDKGNTGVMRHPVTQGVEE